MVDASVNELSIMAVILSLVAVAFWALVVLVIAAAAAGLWVVGSVLTLLPKFYFAYREGYARSSWPAMLFYLVAPTCTVLIGFGLSPYFEALHNSPAVTDVRHGLLRGGGGMVLGTVSGVALLTMYLASFGLYLWSFSWAHQAYKWRGFNPNTVLLLLPLFIVALFAPIVLAWALG